MKKWLLLSGLFINVIMLKAENKPVLQFDIIRTDTAYQAYVGVYKLDANGMIDTYTVTVSEGKIYGQASGYDNTELTKQTEPHAFKSGYGSDVFFIRDADDKPFTKVKLVIQGNTVLGTKQ